jgi:hypothetical protein
VGVFGRFRIETGIPPEARADDVGGLGRADNELDLGGRLALEVAGCRVFAEDLEDGPGSVPDVSLDESPPLLRIVKPISGR